MTTPIHQLRRWIGQPLPPQATNPQTPHPLAVSGKTDRQEQLDRREQSSSSEVASPPEPSSPPPSPPPPKRRRSGWQWTIVCFAALGLISGMGSAALLWLVSLPPPPDCEDPSRLTLDMERLYCAQKAIDAGGLPELIAGLELLKQQDTEDSLQAEIQKLSEEWSKQVLTIARSKANNSDLQGALDAIQHIPDTTPTYEDAQRLVAYWQEQWADGEAIYARAQEAFKEQNWTLASQQIAIMAELANPYWHNRRANELAQQLGVERRARQILIQAQRTAGEGGLSALGRAITQAQEIAEGTYAWEEARPLFAQWSRSLLEDSIQKWQAGNPAGAMNTLGLANVKTSAPELQDLVRFGDAYRLANQSFPGATPAADWFPELRQLRQLREAVVGMGQVPADSPFYESAQAMQADLQAQWDDLIQLYYASLTANLGQHASYHLAIDQAQQITPDRPRRLQAQTLIAYWRDQIEQIEDQPYLDGALWMARSGRKEDLQRAIAEASLIQQGRALRLTAQGHIATWRRQIESIEDKPLLDRAFLLADEGQLSEAIRTAQEIASGRALYNEAQTAIAEWQAQLVRTAQLAEDRPILSRARSLADGGNLGEAIRIASQISPGRALYREAQAAIAEWQAQLTPPRRDRSSETDLPDEPSLPNELNNSPPSPGTLDPRFPIPNGTTSPSPGTPSSPYAAPSSLPIEPVLPDRIETVPPYSPSGESPAPSLEFQSPLPIEERFPAAAPESAPSPSVPSGSPYEGYYDERFFESN
ncbi:hypothetical protein [Egbenema bharatensis]|uniref:hypothetical protein n=1 Tax=Egbenema bharatensis TaxID=3463334 RepID=UPI003A8BAA1A